MNGLQKRVYDLILTSALFPADRPIIIGVSGGADSISLLHILSALFPATKRVAVYIDHGLRPTETEAEKYLVQQQAKVCSAHFKTIVVDVTAKQQSKHCSLEEAARELRYQVLENVRSSYNASSIAVGHTADDQAEEVLLRLIRGSGSTGLSGMDLQNGYIIRPLLHETKSSLLDYIKKQKIPHCEDSSNFDPRFLRNRIRLELLPKLEEDYNQSIRKTLLQTAAILNGEDQLLQDITELAYRKHVHRTQESLSLSLSTFTQEPVAIQRRILDKICWTMASKPSYKKIESLLAVTVAVPHKEIHLSGGLRAIREDKTLRFHRPSEQNGYRGPGIIKKSFAPISINGPGIYPVTELKQTLLVRKLPFSPKLLDTPNTQLIDADTVAFPLLLRQAQEGEWFHPFGAPGKKKVARFLSDHKVPGLKRDNYPLILSKDKVVAIAGMRIDHLYRVTENTKQVFLLQWQLS